MIQLIRRVSMALIALVAFGQAQAAAPALPALAKVADLQAATRPAGVPLDYVVTPNGFFHASCVMRIDDDEKVQADGSVLKRDGSIRQVAACTHLSFGKRGEPRAAIAQTEPEFDGWLVDSDTDPSVTPAASEMSAQFVVPSAPTHVTGQTLYYFPGLESVPRTVTILQPVLAWGGYTGSAWTMANWNCCIRGTVYTGNPITVNTGDRIFGQMVGTGCSAKMPCTGWSIVSTDQTTSASTTMSTRAYGQVFDWYFGGVMEVYGVSTCNQFPASGGIAFTHVEVKDSKSSPVTPVWSTSISSSAPACDYAAKTTTGSTTISWNPTL